MRFGERLFLMSATVAMCAATANAQTAVVTFPDGSTTTQSITTPQVQVQVPQQIYGAGGYGYYNQGTGQSQPVGSVQLCGQPPYVYPCGYANSNPYQQQQPMVVPNAAMQQQTFGLQQQVAPAATFPAQVGTYVDQSPSTTNNGIGNTAGPIMATPPATSGIYDGGTYTRSEIANPNSAFYEGGRDRNVKQVQIRNTAYQVGIRAGFAAEAQRINRSMIKYRYEMDKAFDFEPLMEVSGSVVPPVITTVTDVVERRAANYLYLTTGAYEIVQPALVTIKTPSWQDYLELDGGGPRPPAGIKVKTDDEKAVWSEAANSGWDRGVKEARAAFSTGFDRLARDYKGIKTYHRLAEMGAVSLTKVAVGKNNGSITKGGNKATGAGFTVKLMVQPKFKSQRAIVTALEEDRQNNTAPRKK